MRKPIALFDLDGSLADYYTSMQEELAKIQANQELHINEDIMKARRDLIKWKSGFWKNLKPISQGFEVLNLCRKIGYEINILTKGPQSKPHAWAEKLEWVRKYVGDEQTHIVADKGLVYGNVLYDDWDEYINDWLAWRPRGRVIMPICSWNRPIKDHAQVTLWNGKNIEELATVLQNHLENYYKKC